MNDGTKVSLIILFSGIGLFIVSLFVCNIYFYDCFVCHGIAPSFLEGMFCIGVQTFPIVCIVLVIGSLVSLFRSWIYDKKEG